MAKLVKKITSKILGFDKETILELVLKNKKEEIDLYHIIGGAFKATVEDSDNGMGEYIKLSGKFEGINVNTNESMTAGVLILPDVASNAIAGELLGSTDEQAYAEIALTVTAKYDKDAVASYVYGAKLHNANENAFDKLKALIPSLAKTLPKTEKKAIS